VDRSDAAFPINQKRRGERFHSTIKISYRIIAHHDAIIDAELVREGLHHIPPVLIHRHAKHCKALVLVLPLEIFEPWDFYLARPAPRRPEIQQNHFAFVIGKMHRMPIRILQCKLRRGFAFLLRLQGSGPGRAG